MKEQSIETINQSISMGFSSIIALSEMSANEDLSNDIKIIEQWLKK